MNKNKMVEWALRLGLGGMYLYSGYDIFMHPTGWTWALRPLPQFIQSTINSTVGNITYLKIQGAGEFLLGLALLMWFLPRVVGKVAGLISAIEIFLILLLVGIDSVTFRDIGVLGASLGLWFLLMEDTPYAPRTR